MQDLKRLRRCLFALIAAAYAISLALAHLSGLRVDYASHAPFLLWVLGLLAIISGYCSWRGLEAILRFAEPACAVLLATPAIVLSTYVAMHAGFPEADPVLSLLDRRFGFDWWAFIAVIDRHAALALVLQQAYQSFSLQLLGLPMLLGFFGQAARAYRMVIAYVLIGLVSSLVSVMAPARGTFPTYGLGPDQLSVINAKFGFFFLSQYEAVRSDPDFVFRLREAAGILTFPSVHAAVAVLCVWAAWRLPVLNIVFALLNLAMIVSAISHANHYLVDVLAGSLVAALCLGAAQAMTRARSSTPVRAGRLAAEKLPQPG